MRKLIHLLVQFTAITVVGCSESEPPTDDPAKETDPGPPPKLAFDPGLKLKWPGSPEESSHAFEATDGKMKSYTAMLVDKRADGVTVFSASVSEFSEDALKETTIKELMFASVFAFRKDEVSRKEIEHGPAKHAGLDILSRSDGRTTRKLVVAAGNRVYVISATSRGEEMLKALRVTEFFDSLVLGN